VESADEADALAIAICHANHRGIRQLEITEIRKRQACGAGS
jgi:Holliday junction resolvasome RuvABC endonuclease subunit